MKNGELKKEIRRLKNEKDAVILVHNYQIGAIQEMADYLDDSLVLAREASHTNNQMIVFCGVLFMAETAKILSPEKTVLLPNDNAGCKMAQMVDVENLRELKIRHPDAKVVTYINSSSEVKAESDVCCTSANAVDVVNNIESEKIIFTPDRNLGSYVQRFTNKEIILWDGYCYVHQKITKEDTIQTKQSHPDSILMVHPECRPEVIDLADEVQSTGGMMRIVEKSSVKEFIIGTEEGLLERLRREYRDKKFYSIKNKRLCAGMKVTDLKDLYNALLKDQYKVEVTAEIMEKAGLSLKRMLLYVK